MPSEILESEFDQLINSMKTALNEEYKLNLSFKKDNPYLYIKTPNKIPDTRTEVKAVLKREFSSEQSEQYVISFVNLTKSNEGQFIYKTLIKEQTPSVFN